MCVAARVSRAFFAIFLQPRLALPKMALCAEQRFQISIRPLALVRQGSCVKEHTEFSGSIPAAYDRYLGPVLFQRYAEDLAARVPVKKTSSVLELACGTGILTRVPRSYLPSKVKLIEFERAHVPAGRSQVWQGRESAMVGS